MTSAISWDCGLRIVDLSEVAKQMQCKECSSLLDLKSTQREDRIGLASILFISCQCGVLNDVHTSGYVKTEMGTIVYTLNTQLISSLLQLEMEPSKVYQLLSGLSIPIPHLPLLEPVSSGVSTKLTSPPSVPVPQQSVEEKSPVSGDNKSTLDGNEGVLVGYKGTMDGNQGDSKGTLDGNQVVQGGYKGTVDGNQGVQGGYKGTLDGNQVILDDDKGTLGDSKGRLGGIQDTVGDSQGAVGDNRGTQDRNQGVLDENRDNLDKHLLIHKGFSEARTVFVEKTSTTSVWFMERDLYGGEAELETPFVGLSVFPLRKWRETSVDSPSTELTDALGDVQRGQDPVYNDRPKSVVQHEGETSPSYKASCVPSLEKTRTKRSMKKILFPQNVASGAHRQSPLVAANMGMKTVHSPLAVADVGIKTVHSPLVTADVGIKTVHSPLVAADVGIKTVHSPLVAADVGIKTVHSPLVAADVDMKTVYSPLVAAVNMKTVPSPLVVATDCNRSSVTKTTQCPQGEAVIHRKVEEVQCPQGVGSGVSRGQGDPVRQSYDYQKRRKRKTGPCQPQKAAQTLADWPFQDVLAAGRTKHTKTAPDDNDLKLKLPTISRRGKVKEPSRKMCEVCGLSLSSCSALSRHRRLKHRASRPVLCPVTGCGKLFARSQLLESHINCRHSETKPFQCFRCGKQFGAKKYLSDHLARCGEAAYKCHLCHLLFRDRAARRDHVAKRHEGHFFVCHCGKVYEWRTSLAKHQKKCPPS